MICLPPRSDGGQKTSLPPSLPAAASPLAKAPAMTSATAAIPGSASFQSAMRARAVLSAGPAQASDVQSPASRINPPPPWTVRKGYASAQTLVASLRHPPSRLASPAQPLGEHVQHRRRLYRGRVFCAMCRDRNWRAHGRRSARRQASRVLAQLSRAGQGTPRRLSRACLPPHLCRLAPRL